MEQLGCKHSWAVPMETRLCLGCASCCQLFFPGSFFLCVAAPQRSGLCIPITGELVKYRFCLRILWLSCGSMILTSPQVRHVLLLVVILESPSKQLSTKLQLARRSLCCFLILALFLPFCCSPQLLYGLRWTVVPCALPPPSSTPCVGSVSSTPCVGSVPQVSLQLMAFSQRSP